MWTQKYVGKPFRDHGRGPDVYDCWGLVIDVYRNDRPVPVILPGHDDLYGNTKDHAALMQAFDSHRDKWREVDQPQEFDVILLAIMNMPIHVGIVVRPGVMIHCVEGPGTVIESYTGMRWKHKVRGFFRHE